MYFHHFTRIEWNGFRSVSFRVLNGVKQGGIVSPIMFCVYFDKLLVSLAESGVGCYIGRFFVGALAYHHHHDAKTAEVRCDDSPR